MIATIATNQFTFLPKTKTMIAEISDLGARVFQQVYDDACDLGVRIVSSDTRREATFVVQEERYDNNNDLEAWILIPTTDTIRRVPRLNGVKMVILND